MPLTARLEAGAATKPNQTKPNQTKPNQTKPFHYPDFKLHKPQTFKIRKPNAGYFHDYDAAAFRRMMDLNYMGVVHAVRAVLPGMVARRGGHLIAVASTLSLMGALRCA